MTDTLDEVDGLVPSAYTCVEDPGSDDFWDTLDEAIQHYLQPFSRDDIPETIAVFGWTEWDDTTEPGYIQCYIRDEDSDVTVVVADWLKGHHHD